MTDAAPATDDRHPGQVVECAVAHALTLVAGVGRQPLAADDRVYTPHKAIRRLSDHLLDHLAELEARLAGDATLPYRWHASAVPTLADLAPFTVADLDEARSRLTRLAQIWSLRLRALDAERLDRQEEDAWTLRQVAFHLGDTFYSDAVGDLTSPRPEPVASEAGLYSSCTARDSKQNSFPSGSPRTTQLTSGP